MSLGEIAALPIGALIARDALLFLWVVQPLLMESRAVLEAWGFRYKTLGFVWVKTTGHQRRLFYDAGADVQRGPGYHSRAGAELCLIATHGKGYERLDRGVPQVIFAPRREHSRKPDESLDGVERLVKGPYVELFARTPRPRWDAWGDKVGRWNSCCG